MATETDGAGRGGGGFLTRGSGSGGGLLSSSFHSPLLSLVGAAGVCWGSRMVNERGFWLPRVGAAYLVRTAPLVDGVVVAVVVVVVVVVWLDVTGRNARGGAFWINFQFRAST